MNNLHYALRQALARPGYSLIIILTLALGIGATTAIYSVASVTVLQPLPFPDEHQMVRIYMVPKSGQPRISPRADVFNAVREQTRSFEHLVAQRYTTFTLQTDEGPERLAGISVSEGWSSTLGVTPVLGRGFTQEEMAQGAQAGVVVLSHSTWQSHFGGQPDVLEQTMSLDGLAHRVIGVMPRGFQYPYSAAFWVPFQVDGPQVGPWAFNINARLAPGVSLEAAQEELLAVTKRAVEDIPGFSEDRSIIAVPLRETLLGDTSGMVAALVLASVFLLLIVCANLANLILVRGLTREREFAVREMLGAGRKRLVKQLFTESLVYVPPAILLGAGTAYALTGLLGALVPGPLASDFGIAVTVEPGVWLFAIGITFVCVVVFGLAPAVQLSTRGTGDVLRGGTRGSGGLHMRRITQTLIIGELGLALMLLSGAGFLYGELRARQLAEVGYEDQGLLVFTVSLARPPYDEPTARIDLIERAAEALEAMPGIESAGVTSTFPSHRGNTVRYVEVEGMDMPGGERLLVNHRLVDADFLGTLGIPLLQGRNLSGADGPDGRPSVLVSAEFARRLWPGGDALGQRVRNERLGPEAPWMTVVGVVGDVREYYDLDATWYLPFAQHANTDSATSATFAVRGFGGQPPPLAAVQEAISRVDPNMPPFDVAHVPDLHAEALAQPRQAAWLAGAGAGFGLLLSVIGLYGSIAYAVSRRTREIGIRMALGSDRTRVVGMVIKSGARLLLIAVVLGFAGTLILVTVLEGMLAGTQMSLHAFIAALLVLVTTASIALFVPARRAARIDPMQALREE